MDPYRPYGDQLSKKQIKKYHEDIWNDRVAQGEIDEHERLLNITDCEDDCLKQIEKDEAQQIDRSDILARVQELHSAWNSESSSSILEDTTTSQHSLISRRMRAMVTHKLYHPDFQAVLHEYNQSHNTDHTLHDLHLIFSTQPLRLKKFIEDVSNRLVDGGGINKMSEKGKEPKRIEQMKQEKEELFWKDIASDVRENVQETVENLLKQVEEYIIKEKIEEKERSVAKKKEEFDKTIKCKRAVFSLAFLFLSTSFVWNWFIVHTTPA